MKLGAHISSAKPFSDSVLRAKEIGCECMQIFANPPQRWNPIPIPDEEVNRFLKLQENYQIEPVIVHSIYLVNFASTNPFFYEQSIKSLIDDMNKASQLNALGANTHLGSTKGGEFKDCLPKITQAIRQILAATSNVNFIIENSAGAGNIMGDTLTEIGQIIKELDRGRVKVLIDTAHAFESGYDIRTRAGLEDFLGELEQEIGLDLLVGFHLNDSKTPLDSKRDRHADIGKGEIGIEAFKFLLSYPKLTDKFGILETPQDEISWQDQLKLLREL